MTVKHLSEISDTKRTAIVLTHGAWHRPVHFEGLAEPLRKNFLVEIPALETAGPADVVRGKGFQDDVEALRQVLQPHFDAGREIVVVAHSLGGIVGSEAVAGITVQERRDEGLAGGVKAVVFIASLLVFAGGVSFSEQIGSEPNESWYGRENDVLVLKPGGEKIFYNDIDEAKAMDAIAKVQDQSFKSFTDKIEHGALSIRAPMTYVIGEKDVAIPPAFLHAFADGLGDKCKKVSFDCGHTPWMRDDVLPELVGIITEAATA